MLDHSVTFNAADSPAGIGYWDVFNSVSVDLFGQELSSNAASYFTAGLKGRYLESRLDGDHRLAEEIWPVHAVRGGRGFPAGAAPSLFQYGGLNHA